MYSTFQEALACKGHLAGISCYKILLMAQPITHFDNNVSPPPISTNFAENCQRYPAKPQNYGLPMSRVSTKPHISTHEQKERSSHSCSISFNAKASTVKVRVQQDFISAQDMHIIIFFFIQRGFAKVSRSRGVQVAMAESCVNKDNV